MPPTPCAPDVAEPTSGAVRGTWCYLGTMSVQDEISQRDLRLRSKEIMDSVQRGQSFTVTRDGHQIGELIPLRRQRTFVARADFVSGPVGARPIDIDQFRADLDEVVDNELDDPYAR